MSRLAQILKDKASDTMDNGIRNIHYQDIKPSPNNKFGIRDIDDLAEDIAATGLDHNIVIRPIDHPDFKYEIIAGERRYTAICKLIEQGNLTYEYIPAKVVKLDDNKSRKKLILNNLMGRTITPEEMLQAVADLEELYIEEKKTTGLPGRVQHLIANDLGLRPSQTGYYQRINHKAIPEVKEMISTGELTITEAAELASMEADEQLKFVESAEDSEITIQTVREFKNLVGAVPPPTDIVQEYPMPVAKKEVIDEELDTDDFIRSDDMTIGLEDYEPDEEFEEEDDYDNLDEPQEMNITELIELINDSLLKLDKKINGVEFRQERQYLKTVSEDFNEFRQVLGV